MGVLVLLCLTPLAKTASSGWYWDPGECMYISEQMSPVMCSLENSGTEQ